MLGYLIADSSVDEEGWHSTKDIVEVHEGYHKVTVHNSEVINVGGLKFMDSEVERVALQYEHFKHINAETKPNSQTGKHVELMVQQISYSELDKAEFKAFLAEQLPKHMMPKRIREAFVSLGHRFKRRGVVP